MSKKDEIERDFYPLGNFDGKKNFQPHARIERDGSVVNGVFLSVPDIRKREEIILSHYLSFIVRHVIKEDIGVNIGSRDNPWDFFIETSIGAAFNVEITSLADNKLHHEVMKREEFFLQQKSKHKIEMRQFKKLAEYFGGEEMIELYSEHLRNGMKSADLIENPFYSEGPIAFLSMAEPSKQSAEEAIKAAIQAKVEKPHADKDATVLVLDNRSNSYKLRDVQGACHALKEVVSKAPFPEIWFYSGYFSDDTGNNSEFSMLPFKIPTSWSKFVVGEMYR